MDDELGDRQVDGVVGEGERLGDAGEDPQTGEPARTAATNDSDGSTARDGIDAEPRDELGGQGSRTAADVERPRTGRISSAAANLTASGSENRPMNRKYTSGVTSKPIHRR